ncbi:STAS domain-containing protein [Nocardioides sp. Kera G14]|uniref:STAS domain-containing protein n=1 Tax=Nocardioides sp. Kera G14 TaxID=2884264 RepID=UPI001D11CF24|nr:STAS domain-containing protein [Nocardioides sp. Kera G14]
MSSTGVLLQAPRAWVILHGEYDVASRDELECRFSTVERWSCDELYVDVGQVTFIDCAALGVIVGARRRLVPAGGSMTVIGATSRFERICRLSGYLELLRARPDGQPECSGGHAVRRDFSRTCRSARRRPA